MKNVFIFTALIMLVNSCDVISGNGNVRSEKRSPANFHAVKSSGSIDVEIHTGDTYAVTVEDDDNLLPQVVTEVDNGTLEIHYRDNISVSRDHAKVHVTAPSLDKLVISGSADMTILDVLKNAQKIDIEISGSGDLKGPVDAPAVSVDINGSGNVELKGSTKDFDCTVSGSGDVNCGGLQSENTNISVSGSGSAHVFASVHLAARVAGSGDIYYSGNPSNPEIHTAGSGTVQPEK